jgi:hypothetical protein
LDDVQFGQAQVPDLSRFQGLGDDADDPAIGLEASLRHFAHQADAATAIDQLPAQPADGLPDLACGLRVAGRGAVSGAAIDGDGKARSVHRRVHMVFT